MKKIRPNFKAIFLSGNSVDILLQRGMIENDPNFLTKPMRPLELLKKVREVLERTN